MAKMFLFSKAKRQILWRWLSHQAWTMMGTSAARVFGVVALGAACCFLAAVWGGGASRFVELFADPGQTARAQKQWREMVKSEETNNGQAVRRQGAHPSCIFSRERPVSCRSNPPTSPSICHPLADTACSPRSLSEALVFSRQAVGFHRHRRYHVADQMRSAELGRMVHRQHLNYLPLLPKVRPDPVT